MTSTPSPAGSRRNAPSPTRGRRTSVITIAAIAGVLVAGSAAVAANIGILNAADSSEIGELAATDELLTTPTATAAVPTATISTSPAAAADAAQRFDIDTVGSVWIVSTTSGLALDHVELTAGWTPALTQTDIRSLRIDFTDGTRTVSFTAMLAVDGSIAVDVVEPITLVEPSATLPGVGPTGTVASPPVVTTDDHDDDDDRDDDRDDDHDDDRDDDHDDDRDDDHEYEGADDDD